MITIMQYALACLILISAVLYIILPAIGYADQYEDFIKEAALCVTLLGFVVALLLGASLCVRWAYGILFGGA